VFHGDLILDDRFVYPLTLGRIKKPKQLKTNFDQQSSINLKVDKVLFNQSTLSPSGSIYTVLKETLMI